MKSRLQQFRWGSVLLDFGFHGTQFLITTALATIAGYMLIGGLAGTLLMMCGFNSAARSATAIGWILGGIIGVGGEVGRLRRLRRQNASGKSVADDDEKPSGSPPAESQVDNQLRFCMPTLGQFLKTTGFGVVLGAVAGVAASLFLSIILISITTSPFVPDSWRPGTHAAARDLHEPMNHRRRRDGVTTGFSHPLLEPIFIYATGTLCTLGLLSGGVLAFFEDRKP